MTQRRPRYTKFIDGGYLSWTYGVNTTGWRSWNEAKLQYSENAGAVMLMDSYGFKLFRQEYYPHYKQHRRERRASSEEQAARKELVDDFKAMLFEDPTLLKITIPGFEADDLIGVLSLFCSAKHPLRVVGIDKDLLQLGANLELSKHSGERVTFEHFLRRQPKTVAPFITSMREIVLILTLLGDRSDDVPRIIPPYELDLLTEILNSADPWRRAIELFDTKEVIRNLYLTILPGPWCLDPVPTERDVFRWIRAGTYLRRCRLMMSWEFQEALEPILRYI